MMMPGGNPVTALPGLIPRSPVTVPEPVIADPARTAKLSAVRRLTNAGFAQNVETGEIKYTTKIDINRYCIR